MMVDNSVENLVQIRFRKEVNLDNPIDEIKSVIIDDLYLVIIDDFLLSWF